MILTCVRKLAPIASQARHFPPCSGEADAKEKNYSFYYFIYTFDDNLCRILRSFSYAALNIYHHSDSAHRSRMTAEVNCVSVWD